MANETGSIHMSDLAFPHDIRIASPCRESLDEMPGDDRVRSCSECSRPVYNIATMTSNEVASPIANREDRICARLFRSADGTVITADCPVTIAQPTARPKARRLRSLVIIILALVLTWTGTKSGAPTPSGSDVTLDDWAYWASVSLGLRPAPPSTPVFHTVTMGDVY